VRPLKNLLPTIANQRKFRREVLEGGGDFNMEEKLVVGLGFEMMGGAGWHI
jgi:hypothetical protein